MKFAIEYNTINSIQGPLVIVDKVRNAAYNEIVRINMPNGESALGQVLESSAGRAVVQVFGIHGRAEHRKHLCQLPGRDAARSASRRTCSAGCLTARAGRRTASLR